MFWTSDLYERIIPILSKQFAVALRLENGRAAENPSQALLVQCYNAFALSTTSDITLKSLNTSILMTTRSEDPQVRIASLMALHGIWIKQEELVQFVPETVAQFLSELLEDENADVEVEARKVLSRIEGLVGDLSSYLE